MDWFAWLSKSGLDPSLARRYALTFTYNELEREDLSYFSHEFLQSMGVSLAKHRLEIIKMAGKEKFGKRTMNWLVFALRQAKSYLAKHAKALPFRRQSSSNLPIVLPARSSSLRWKVASLQRKKPFSMNSAEPKRLGEEKKDGPESKLLLTYGSYGMADEPHSSEFIAGLKDIAWDGQVKCDNTSFSSTLIRSMDDGYWSSSDEEIKWDLMFGNLKPT